ncbi:peroxisome targeting signal receptor [Pleurotus eryngii]|uniref:Peroxisome targeting signal receptor n=1 Tax=Pleurotus eryngii TaxID=5323 RepID=A0A9P6DEG6_PLEER|nr:peroxisome targeting signal receptor [Pleurotus eryngii]
MSFSGLISGSECAVAANPLSQVLKHTEGDRSLQQDRIAGPSSSRLHHFPGTSAAPLNEHDAAMARQFFEGGGQGPVPMIAIPPMELQRMVEATGMPPQELREAWAMERQLPQESLDWSSEYSTMGKAPTPMQQNMTSLNDGQQRSYPSSFGMYGGAMPARMYGIGMGSSMMPNYQGMQEIPAQGKGKAREADFEAAFAQAAESMFTQAESSARIVEVDADVASVEEALKGATLEDKEESDFKRVWDHLQDSDLPPPKEDLAKWEAEFNQLMNKERSEDTDYGTTMQQAWEGGLGNYEGSQFDNSPMKFDSEGLPLLGEYIFDPYNKYLGPTTSTRSPLADAKYLLDNNGSLSEATLLLEAAIQKGELGEGGYEAWILLGDTRTMDEHEDAGMRALLEGVKRAEAAGAPGAGMLSLAISFTNESYDRASHTMLLRWLRSRFPDHPVPEETVKALSTNSSWDTHTRVTEVFINLARAQHASGQLDPDVQVGLGVLFYTNGEYDRSKDCFEAALGARPRDFLLWNRLGSALSNGNKPEEALGAYREALQLRPTYTRAIFNVGVACMNIGAHKEAAEHFLTALSLQETNGGGNTASDQLWFTLRRTFLAMDRQDLANLAKPETRTNLDTFRKEGFDF